MIVTPLESFYTKKVVFITHYYRVNWFNCLAVSLLPDVSVIFSFICFQYQAMYQKVVFTTNYSYVGNDTHHPSLRPARPAHGGRSFRRRSLRRRVHFVARSFRRQNFVAKISPPVHFVAKISPPVHFVADVSPKNVKL